MNDLITYTGCKFREDGAEDRTSPNENYYIEIGRNRFIKRTMIDLQNLMKINRQKNNDSKK
jgi:hypothetical protein